MSALSSASDNSTAAARMPPHGSISGSSGDYVRLAIIAGGASILDCSTMYGIRLAMGLP